MSTVANRVTEIATGEQRRGLRPWLALLVVIVFATVGLLPTFIFLGPKWLDSFGYSHGPLIAAICAWLLWRERRAIDGRVPRPSALALVALVAVLFGWALSYAASVSIGVEFLWPAAIWLAAAVVLGLPAAWRLAFPIGFLYFAIPVWDAINGVLQSMTTAVVSVLLPVLSVPAYIQGNHVQIPAGWFEIAGGCSGLHFFVVGLALASLYGYLYYRAWSQRLVLLGFAAVMALVINYVRVTTIIVAGHLTDMQSYLVQVDHYTFGWVLFAVALVPFYMFARRLERPEQEAPAETQLPSARVSTVWLGLTAALLLSPAALWLRPASADVEVAIALPTVPGWQGPTVADDSWQPAFPGAHGEARGRYERAGTNVQLYLNWYASQSQGRELIGFGNRVQGEATVVGRDLHKLELDRGAELSVREMIFGSQDAGRRLVWYWYQIGPRPETNTAVAKLYGGWRALAGDSGAGLVAASVACETDCRRARTVLTDWLQSAETPARGALLNAARGGSED